MSSFAVAVDDSLDRLFGGAPPLWPTPCHTTPANQPNLLLLLARLACHKEILIMCGAKKVFFFRWLLLFLWAGDVWEFHIKVLNSNEFRMGQNPKRRAKWLFQLRQQGVCVSVCETCQAINKAFGFDYIIIIRFWRCWEITCIIILGICVSIIIIIEILFALLMSFLLFYRYRYFFIDFTSGK